MRADRRDKLIVAFRNSVNPRRGSKQVRPSLSLLFSVLSTKLRQYPTLLLIIIQGSTALFLGLHMHRPTYVLFD
jgi:hypothetical protein